MEKPMIMSLTFPPFRFNMSLTGQMELETRSGISWPWPGSTKISSSHASPPRPNSNVPSTVKYSQFPHTCWSLSLLTLRELTSNCILSTLNSIIFHLNYLERKLLWLSPSYSGRSLGRALDLFLFVCLLLILISMCPDHRKDPDT